MKVKWAKETPIKKGWYWIKYKNKHKEYVVCPCEVVLYNEGHLKGTALVHTARNDSFIEGPRHGGPGLKDGGKLCPDIRFGPWLGEEPEP